MSRTLPLLLMLAGSACREPTFTPQPDSDCAGSDCDTDTDSDPDTDTGLPCEPVIMEGGSLETSDCRERPDPFQVRLEWELRPYMGHTQKQLVVPRWSEDTKDSRAGWLFGGAIGGQFVRGDGSETVAWPDIATDSDWSAVFGTADIDGSGTPNTIAGQNDGSVHGIGPEGQTIAGEPGLPLSVLGGMNVVDVDLDGSFDLQWGRLAVSLDGGVISDAELEELPRASWQSTVADVDGDGRREIVTDEAIYSEYGGLMCRFPDPHPATVFPLDIDGDNNPEVLLVPLDGADDAIRIMNHECAVVSSRPTFTEEYGLSTLGYEVLAIAPLETRERPSVALSLYARTDDGIRMHNLAVLNHKLEPVFFSRGNPHVHLRGSSAADLDGDGLHELVVRGLSTGLELQVVDIRSGRSTVVVSQGVNAAQIADVDGDHHAEIIVTGEDDDGTFLQVYGGVGPEWQSATPTWMHRHFHPAWVQNPDGSPTAEPVDWSRVGMLNASPSFAWWWGVGGNLVVDIAEVCEDRCDEGRLTAWVRVGNDGVEEVGRPVRVDVYGVRGDQEELVGSQTYDRVPSGVWLPAEPLEITFEGEPFEALRAEVAGDGWTVDECDAGDNTARQAISCD